MYVDLIDLEIGETYKYVETPFIGKVKVINDMSNADLFQFELEVIDGNVWFTERNRKFKIRVPKEDSGLFNHKIYTFTTED